MQNILELLKTAADSLQRAEVELGKSEDSPDEARRFLALAEDLRVRLEKDMTTLLQLLIELVQELQVTIPEHDSFGGYHVQVSPLLIRYGVVEQYSTAQQFVRGLADSTRKGWSPRNEPAGFNCHPFTVYYRICQGLLSRAESRIKQMDSVGEHAQHLEKLSARFASVAQLIPRFVE